MAMAAKLKMLLAARNIDFENELLILKTQYYYDGKGSENADIVFNGYFIHIFDMVFYIKLFSFHLS
jgi:hypothetical protein